MDDSPSQYHNEMAPSMNKRITLRERPIAEINVDLTGKGTFNLETVPVPTLAPGQALCQVAYLSIDPAMRGWLNDSRSYLPPVQISETMRSGGVGRIIETTPGSKFQKGDWINGLTGWQEYAVVSNKDVTKIDVTGSFSPSYFLGALGMPAMTAYFGMLDVAKIKAGETVVVSGAAGAVGTVACQIAKLKGCRVIAIAGGEEKCNFLKELGVDATLDYKSPDFRNDFKKTVGYLDVYFDNVGGEILDLCLTRLKQGARIALCGAISAYNDPNPKGLQMYLNLISQRASIKGFIVFDYASQYGAAEKDLIQWISEGKMKIRETQVVGLENCPSALVGLFTGVNTGKLVVKLVSESGSKL